MRIVFREVDRNLFEAVGSGLKPIETRAGTKKFQSIKPGDEVTFACGKDKIGKVVFKVEKYSSPEEMYGSLPFKKVSPFAKSEQEAINMHKSFTGYRKKIEEHGIIALFLKR